MLLTFLILTKVFLDSCLIAQTSCGVTDLFNMIEGFLCIRSDFIEIQSNVSTYTSCALYCDYNQRCQAFTMTDSPCQLFVFDKCSKWVRDCNCTRRGKVFVKQQPGLEAGQLCPTGYGDDLCGVKYKLLAGTDFWWPSRQKCESEAGLVIMADVANGTEMDHVEVIYSKYSLVNNMWLGGFQPTGSPEPRGGWYWVGCNITVDDSLWNTVEPNNFGGSENVIGRYVPRIHLADFWQSVEMMRVLCECVSPFN